MDSVDPSPFPLGKLAGVTGLKSVTLHLQT